MTDAFTRLSRVVFLGAVVGAMACAGQPSPAGVATSDVLRPEEIVASPATTAGQAVEALRPMWLHNRGALAIPGGARSDRTSPGQESEPMPNGPAWFLDGDLANDAARNVSVSHILAIRFLDPSEAGTRYGRAAVRGAILVTTK